MSSEKPPKVEFTEDHINYIFNYLNEMYSDRLTSIEKLVTRNSQSLQSLKQDLDVINNSLNSIFLVNNYKLNTNNSLTSNFTDFFHNFVQISEKTPLKVLSKSLENHIKSPIDLKSVLKSPKIARKAEETPKKRKEINIKVKKEGFKLVSPIKTKGFDKKKEDISVKNTPRKTPIITPKVENPQKSQNNHKNLMGSKEKREISNEKREFSRDSNLEKDKKNDKEKNVKNVMKKEVIDFKKLLVKDQKKNTETLTKMQETDRKNKEIERKNKEIDRKKQETERKIQETERKKQETERKSQNNDFRSISKEKSYQKGTRSSQSRARTSNEINAVDYTNLIKSVNEFLDFPELEGNSLKNDKDLMKNLTRNQEKSSDISIKLKEKSIKTKVKLIKNNEKAIKTDEKSLKINEKSKKTNEKSIKNNEKPLKPNEKSIKTNEKSIKTNEKTYEKLLKSNDKSIKTNEKTFENDEETYNKEGFIIDELEKHCENLNKLYEEALTTPKDNDNSCNEALTKNTSLGKFLEKSDTNVEFEDSSERKEYYSPQNFKKIDNNYQIKVMSYPENKFKGENNEGFPEEKNDSQNKSEESMKKIIVENDEGEILDGEDERNSKENSSRNMDKNELNDVLDDEGEENHEENGRSDEKYIKKKSENQMNDVLDEEENECYEEKISIEKKNTKETAKNDGLYDVLDNKEENIKDKEKNHEDLQLQDFSRENTTKMKNLDVITKEKEIYEDEGVLEEDERENYQEENNGQTKDSPNDDDFEEIEKNIEKAEKIEVNEEFVDEDEDVL